MGERSQFDRGRRTEVVEVALEVLVVGGLDSPSPKFIMGGSDEEKYAPPPQKPVDLMRRPILNHPKRGELVYEPFLGSGTTLAAAELTERICCGMELDPTRRWARRLSSV